MDNDWCPENDGAYRAELAYRYKYSLKYKIMSLPSYVSLINIGGDNCGHGLASDYPSDYEDENTTGRANDQEWIRKDDLINILGGDS